jgi:ABC-2 type transport system permease protein
MHPRLVLATADRVLRQLLHDPRTIALMFVVPCVLLGLLAWMYSSSPTVFDLIGPSLLALFPFVIMFLITSITTLRERTTGTLERLLTMPIGKLDILLGYALVFGLVAMLQSLLASLLAVHVYGLVVAGPEWFLVLIAVADAVLGSTLGLFVSAFAKTEFQAVQFMPAFIFPQFLLCGLLLPLNAMPRVLHDLANVLPLTYAVNAMQRVSSNASITSTEWHDIIVVIAFAAAAVLLGAATLRRQTK